MRRAFTLIEGLVVIIIVAIILAIAIPNIVESSNAGAKPTPRAFTEEGVSVTRLGQDHGWYLYRLTTKDGSDLVWVNTQGALVKVVRP